MTIEELREKGWIAFEYIRGSHAYGTNVEGSDEDHGGVFICPPEYLYGLRSQYVEQVADEHNDVVFYEFGRWIELLLNANPTALESLFIPEDCIIGEVHPMVQHIIDHRDEFLSKECFKTLTGYAVGQIRKARGLNKKIVNPVTERKGVLDFCYVPYGQGSTNVVNWLTNHGLKQKYCGLVAIPNMHDLYGLYYDWGTHLICEYGVNLNDYESMKDAWERIQKESEVVTDFDNCSFYDMLYISGVINPYHSENDFTQFLRITPYGFTGIVNENSDSNEVRTTTVPKGIEPLIEMSYNQTGYTAHCKDYLSYKDWEKNRNPVRYENNLGHNYDSKNLMHCMRLTRMGKELALGEGFNVRRKDRDFLLSIRNHELDYDEILTLATKEMEELDLAVPTCSLPDKLDVEKINQLLIEARKLFYK